MSDGPREVSEGLEVDVDVRLVELWGEAAAVQEWTLETVGAFMRAAYGSGYCDALREDRAGRRAELHKAHGYRAE